MTQSEKSNDFSRKYAYSKRIVTDANRKEIEIEILNHIQGICHNLGYRIVKIKIEQIETKQTK